MTLEEIFDKEFGGDKFAFEEETKKETEHKTFLTIDGEKIKKCEPLNIEKELEEIKELLLETELQMKGLEEMLNDMDSQIKDLDEKMVDFEKNVLPRLIKYNQHIVLDMV